MHSGQTEHLTDINARVQKKTRYMHFSGDQLSKSYSADCLAKMPRGRKIKKNVPAKAQDTDTEDVGKVLVKVHLNIVHMHFCLQQGGPKLHRNFSLTFHADNCL
ncbi:hypothetical protein CI610_03415 [invertebrate metagenome]|uniref:Uncharacterized protein n=1 Tax=invertebrate metagenome TaxID=1711999 RepID=A0A2H9T350_9ZZZZ